MKNLIPIVGCSAMLLLAATAGYAQPGAPKPDAKFLPSVTGKNSSIGNIYSPNLYDGSTNINIPIYDFSNDHGGFGVSFSYNTKGIRVDELSGRAALHWNINAGGSISRVMKDLPDEINQVHNSPSAYPGPTLTSVGRWGLYTMTSIPSNINPDGENDEFVVSVGTLNFTFSIGKDGYVFTHPNRRARVEKLTLGNGDPNFKITDEDGNQYFFQPGDYSPGELRSNATNNNILLAYTYVSRWMISKIIFAEGGQITYDYENQDPPNTALYVSGQYRERLSDGAYESLNGGTTPWVNAGGTSGNFALLKAIHYPNNITASFVYDSITATPGTTCPMPLKEVVIKAADGNCTRFSLDKAWHNPGSGATGSISEYTPVCDFNSNTGGRLILRGISIKSCDGAITEPYYTFEYSPYRLPYRANQAMDRMGYNNGTDNGSPVGVGIPGHIFNGVARGNNREQTTDVNIMGAANLVKVNNAYGGTVAFTYELNSGLQNIIPGLPTDGFFLGKDDNDGLRIKTITESDKFHPGNARIKTFTYSGGQRFLTGGYFHYLSDMSLSSGSWVPAAYTVGSYRVSPLQLVSGSNHGYSQVNVESRDQSGNLFGRTEYVFTNLKTGNDTFLLNSGKRNYFETPYTDRQYIKDWMLGLPVKTTEYDQNNLIISRVTNTYTDTLEITSSAALQNNTKIMRARGGSSIDPFTDPVVATDSYLPYTGKAMLSSTLSEKFVNGSSTINDIVNYGYDNRSNVKWTKTRNSRGVYTLSENTYNYDVVEGANPGGTTGLGNLYTMTSDKLEKLVSTERWSLGTSGLNTPANKRLLDASITGLEYANGTLRTKSLYVLQTGSPVAYADYTGVTTEGPVASRYNKVRSAYSGTAVTTFQKASEVQQFDTKGNPVETKLLDLNSYKAMLWDTATGNKLADVSNARYNEIAFTSFELSGSYAPGTTVTDGRVTYTASSQSTAMGSISGGKAYALSTLNPAASITIDGPPAGKAYILSFWSRSGIPAVYAYNTGLSPVAMYLDPLNGWTYYEVKFTPTGAGTISLATQGSATIYVDEVRLFPADAMMQSWTYKPLCGATSATDAAGRITYYEYDKLGRPTIVRNQENQILSRTRYTIN